VLRAFITLGHEEGIDEAVPEIPALVVESFTVFGSREKASSSPDKAIVHIRLPVHRWQKPPHSQSEFIVFQKLSQWVVRVLQSSPRVPVQSFMVSIIVTIPFRSTARR
jgi:hypothetical protein